MEGMPKTSFVQVSNVRGMSFRCKEWYGSQDNAWLGSPSVGGGRDSEGLRKA